MTRTHRPMPRTSRGCPSSRLSSCSPSSIRCLVVLTAAWGAYGFRPTLHESLRRTLASEHPTTTPAGLHTQPAATTAAAAAVAAQSTYSRGRRRFHDGGIVAHSSSSSSIESAGGGVGSGDEEMDHVTAAIAAVERPWLGNGADPMAAARKNLPSSLVAAEEGAGGAGVHTADGGKGKGVPAEEMWLNGPFMAPLPPGPVDVLYVDDDIVVVNKPSGLLCVPGRVEKDSLATRAALELGHYRVDRMIVHRLDMATSGVVIMARTDAALKDLNRQFRMREVRKRYVAMVHGVLSADEGEVDLPLCRNAGCPPLHMVNLEHGKPSLTRWRVLERAADRTRVELTPVSGRSHQLRLHMDAIGHPILGDHFYGTKDSLGLADRCLLHAQTLCLRHPITGERRMFTAPCDF